MKSSISAQPVREKIAWNQVVHESQPFIEEVLAVKWTLVKMSLGLNLNRIYRFNDSLSFRIVLHFPTFYCSIGFSLTFAIVDTQIFCLLLGGGGGRWKRANPGICLTYWVPNSDFHIKLLLHY